MASGADLRLTLLTPENLPEARAIDRSDVPESYVDTADTLMELTAYGHAHHCLGHTFAVYLADKCVGVLLLGEAIPWATDPAEMQREPFYRLMGFVMDRRYRGQGLGKAALEMAIHRVYRDFGVRPIALGCHEDNIRAAAFYQRLGFVPTEAFEGRDRYYLRYPRSNK